MKPNQREPARARAASSAPPRGLPLVPQLRWIFDRLVQLVIGISGVIAFLAVWQGIAVWRDDPLILVSPLDVGQTFLDEVTTSDYWHHWKVSMNEYAVGMALAILSGVLIGAILGRVPLIRRGMDPLLAAFYSTPTVALAPVFILWFGLGITSKVMIIWYVAVLPIIVTTSTGVANVDPAYIEVARAFRASTWKMATEVLVPAAMPSVIGGLRIGAGVGLIGVILGEFFGSNAGLGYLVLFATNRFDLALLFLGVISLASVGIVITFALRYLEERVAG